MLSAHKLSKYLALFLNKVSFIPQNNPSAEIRRIWNSEETALCRQFDQCIDCNNGRVP